MKIALFGATGRTGRLVLARALEKGYTVTAFTRSPEKLGVQHEYLEVVEGDIRDADKVAAAVKGADAVISTLGPTDNKAEFAVTAGTRNIIAAMKQHGVSRLIVTAGAGVQDPNDAPGLIDRFMNVLIRTVSRNVYEDMAKVVETVRGSGLDWTIVRVPMLTDDPGKGDVKAAWVGKGMGMRLPRADLAAFVVDQVENHDYLHQAPAISS